MDGQKIDNVINAPTAAYTRKDNNKRNNESKAKRLLLATPGRGTPQTPRARHPTPPPPSLRSMIDAVKQEMEDDDW